MKYILLYSSIAFNVLTNVSFNLSAINEQNSFKRWSYFILGLVFGLINSFLFTECLKQLSLQVASAIFFSLTIIGLCIAAHFMFKEEITTLRLGGMLLIIAGVVMVSFK